MKRTGAVSVAAVAGMILGVVLLVFLAFQVKEFVDTGNKATGSLPDLTVCDKSKMTRQFQAQRITELFEDGKISDAIRLYDIYVECFGPDEEVTTGVLRKTQTAVSQELQKRATRVDQLNQDWPDQVTAMSQAVREGTKGPSLFSADKEYILQIGGYASALTVHDEDILSHDAFGSYIAAITGVFGKQLADVTSAELILSGVEQDQDGQLMHLNSLVLIQTACDELKEMSLLWDDTRSSQIRQTCTDAHNLYQEIKTAHPNDRNWSTYDTVLDNPKD